MDSYLHIRQYFQRNYPVNYNFRFIRKLLLNEYPQSPFIHFTSLNILVDAKLAQLYLGMIQLNLNETPFLLYIHFNSEE